jgi:hypothetical protein
MAIAEVLVADLVTVLLVVITVMASTGLLGILGVG